MVEILHKLYACQAHDLGLNFINELIMRFCHCPKWVGRQAFAFICQVKFTSGFYSVTQDLQSHHLNTLLSFIDLIFLMVLISSFNNYFASSSTVVFFRDTVGFIILKLMISE